jgi:UDP-N-acetylmuramyl pentapeptide phosphotransferase/UDP-N-acetylglucosamine-1-phosphate transferase
MGNVRFTHLHGIFGTEEIGYLTSLILSIFAMVVIINAFNLIDGIDGLASGLAIVAASAFGVWFFINGNIQFSILSFALVGSLTGFFIYNVFGKKNKLFMGDTGSLIIGLVISALVVKFNEFNIDKTVQFAIKAAPSVSFAIVIVPLVDTLRVMTIRISKKVSPFLADNNHIHHRLLELIPNHLKVTLIIVTTNILIIAIALFLNELAFNINLQFLIVLLCGIFFSYIPSIILRIKTSQSLKNPNQIRQLS